MLLIPTSKAPDSMGLVCEYGFVTDNLSDCSSSFAYFSDLHVVGPTEIFTK